MTENHGPLHHLRLNLRTHAAPALTPEAYRSRQLLVPGLGGLASRRGLIHFLSTRNVDLNLSDVTVAMD